MTTPTSLVQIVNTPVAEPGKCVVCGSTGDAFRKFIDFGFTIDYYGVVYFCTFCFVEIANACDFIEHSKYLELLKENEGLKLALRNAEKIMGSFRNALRDSLDAPNGPDTLRDLSDPDEISQSFERSPDNSTESHEDSDKSSSIGTSTDVSNAGTVRDATDGDVDKLLESFEF